MKKKNIFACATLALAAFGFTSCSDILDQEPMNSFTDAAVWGDMNLAESFLNECYWYREAENEQGVLFSNYTDESYHMHDYGTSNYTQGLCTPDNYNTGWTEGKGNTWDHYYSGIKMCNQLLERINEVPLKSAGDEELKNQIIGQAYFLRAFYYHYLYGVYGRIPIIDHTYDLNSEFNETRADMDSVADFIVDDLDEAARLLPVEYNDASDYGRATKGAALALKGRVLLWKASPLFGTPSKEKWEAAAAANKAVIDLNYYSLRQVKNSDEYADLFIDPYNPENIFMKLYDDKWITSGGHSYFMQTPAGVGNGFEGWSTWQPTYEIVNTFQMADGTPFVEASTEEYTLYPGTVNERKIQATTVNPWTNREIRLDANIFYDGSMWGYGDDHRAVEIFEAGEPDVIPGKDSRSGEYWWNGTKTGYNQKKGLDPNFDYNGSTTACTTPWTFIRLSEVYLNYAECMIELEEDAEALKYINLIRNRALLPSATGQDIKAEYRYERTVELMFEGQRFFDLRRWKELENYYNKSENWPTGIKIYKMKDGTLLYEHNTEPVQQRSMDPSKNYWWPVPRYELNRCPNLDAAPYK